jgi:hypothetical protein
LCFGSKFNWNRHELIVLIQQTFDFESSKNSKESSAICKIISVPRVVLSAGSNVNSGYHRKSSAAGSSLNDLVMISTFSATIKAE